ncbi:hypothetical protein A2230_08730 [candidate division WOR-1 bacterium RIFOXYA2_FULL_36_21]|uniref:Uncharacterized protein n=1 Tax=candidate division WOR-1 bacterium RIFOXYB2_FULL_36_35 TaxID=1802578 RepID=A0A1F4RYN1_UNCSA|nr:MAG: hypothetical protein A2230_08730 [candidate division WOR-1 bacterium RIFOXYA2_FULL_36_21]OGC13296.1 MAG: hypothetical protein A2290_08175 [candidate division WOR-1 bacterium RIFOXYB2_FULL_36_35]OGC16617.1 MAG: hypothetical protein A2282_02585 [candidate division WOR-1 bacterium RIFOXYA12_FULL_36_13]
MSKQKLIFIFIGIFGVFLIAFLAVAGNKMTYRATLGNSYKSLTTKTKSTSFLSKQDKFNFLEKYIKFFSPIIDTEYYIDYHDNSANGMTIPGPSDYDMFIVLKVAPKDVNKWLAGFEEISSVQMCQWLKKLFDGRPELNSNSWKRISRPSFLMRKNGSAYIIAFLNEGIIFKYITSEY